MGPPGAGVWVGEHQSCSRVKISIPSKVYRSIARIRAERQQRAKLVDMQTEYRGSYRRSSHISQPATNTPPRNIAKQYKP